MQLSAALTPLQVKSKKRELGFMIEDQAVIAGIINDLPIMKSSSIPKEENDHE